MGSRVKKMMLVPNIPLCTIIRFYLCSHLQLGTFCRQMLTIKHGDVSVNNVPGEELVILMKEG